MQPLIATLLWSCRGGDEQNLCPPTAADATSCPYWQASLTLLPNPASPWLQDTGVEEQRLFGHVHPMSSIQQEGERYSQLR